MKFFLTNSTIHLRSYLLKHKCSIGRYRISAFADGERNYRLAEDVKGESAAIIASVLPDPESLFDLLALYRLLSENGAANTTVIIPYLGYARQDRPTGKGEAAIGVMIAELLGRIKTPKLILIDVHSDLIRRTFDPSVVELSAMPLFAAAFAKRPPDVILSPDAGSIARAERLATLLKPNPEIAVIDKIRPRPNMAVAKRLHGDVKGKNILIIDDMIDTGWTIAGAVKLAAGDGAAAISIAATHGIFSGKAKERLSGLPVNEILITNTLPQARYPKIRRIDVVPIILDALNPSPRPSPPRGEGEK